ncbi:hypothetical protein BH20ACI3_BH20ACI3_15620 [soil metagenome]
MMVSSNASKYGTGSGSDRMLPSILVSMSIQGFTLIVQNIGYGTAQLRVSPEVAFAAGEPRDFSYRSSNLPPSFFELRLL